MGNVPPAAAPNDIALMEAEYLSAESQVRQEMWVEYLQELANTLARAPIPSDNSVIRREPGNCSDKDLEMLRYLFEQPLPEEELKEVHSLLSSHKGSFCSYGVGNASFLEICQREFVHDLETSPDEFPLFCGFVSLVERTQQGLQISHPFNSTSFLKNIFEALKTALLPYQGVKQAQCKFVKSFVQLIVLLGPHNGEQKEALLTEVRLLIWLAKQLPETKILWKRMPVDPLRAIDSFSLPVHLRRYLTNEGTWVGKLSRANTTTAIGSLLNEALLLSILEHPNITPFMGMDIHNQEIILLFKPLTCHLRETVECPQIKESFVDQLLSAVVYIHHHHIWHGDISDSNVMISEENNLHLIDFGAALYIPKKGKKLTQLQFDPKFAAPFLQGHPLPFMDYNRALESDRYSVCLVLLLYYSTWHQDPAGHLKSVVSSTRWIL